MVLKSPGKSWKVWSWKVWTIVVWTSLEILFITFTASHARHVWMWLDIQQHPTKVLVSDTTFLGPSQKSKILIFFFFSDILINDRRISLGDTILANNPQARFSPRYGICIGTQHIMNFHYKLTAKKKKGTPKILKKFQKPYFWTILIRRKISFRRKS